MKKKLFLVFLSVSALCSCDGKDPREAQIFTSLMVAAETGDHQAQRNVAWCYLQGFGVAENHSKAVLWLKKAADGGALKGDILAIVLLGDRYVHGDGVAANLAEAFRLYSIAAERGDVMAAEDLGNLYKEGKGVEKNLPEAWKWYNVAARSEYAAVFPGVAARAAKERDDLATKMSKEEIAEAEAKALLLGIEWAKRMPRGGPYDGLEWPPKKEGRGR